MKLFSGGCQSTKFISQHWFMAWCCQATSHYLSQCWPSSLSPHGVTRTQWVNSLAPGICGNFKSVMDEIHDNFLWNCSQMNAKDHLWRQVNISPGIGLVPSTTHELSLQEAITCANVDPDLGHNKFKFSYAPTSTYVIQMVADVLVPTLQQILLHDAYVITWTNNDQD